MDPSKLSADVHLLMAQAHQQAKDLGHGHVRPEHVLLALLANADTALALADYMVDVAGLKESLRHTLSLKEASPSPYPSATHRPPIEPDSMGNVGRMVRSPEAPLLDPSPDLEALLADVWLKTRSAQRRHILVTDLVTGLLDEGSRLSLAGRLPSKGLKIRDLERGLTEHAPGRPRSGEGGYRTLRGFSRSLTDMARAGLLDPVIGRHREIRRVMQVLCRREKNSPLLVGPAGVGKTSIILALAQRIANDDVPEALKGVEIFALDTGAVQAGAEFRGMLEERIKAILAEVRAGKGRVVLFLEDIAGLLRRGAGVGDLGALLRTALASGEVRMVGVAGPEDYRLHVEKEPALDRLFHVIRVQEPPLDETMNILKGVRRRYETHHELRITDKALEAAALLSHRFVQDRALPDKAIDLLDEASAKVRIEWDALPAELDAGRRRLAETESGTAGLRAATDQASQAQRLTAALETAESQRTAQAALGRLILAQRQRVAWGEMLFAHARALEWPPQAVQEAEAALARSRLALAKGEAELARLHEKARLFKVDLDEEDIAEVVSAWTGVPLSKLMEDERAKLLHMERALHQRVVGQEAAITAVSNAVRLARAGMKDPNRPVGSFLFLGPTGVGKTELCRALAEFLFDDESAMVRIDMSEYMDKHTVSRLVGAPPGYIGYDDSGQLTETVRRRPYSVVLFDEIEKAHPDVFNVLLQIMEDGRLTDGHGRTVDFKNTIVTLTSNVGGRLYREHLGQTNGALHDQLMEELRAHFRPEFLNRLDAIVFFELLTQDQIKQIVDIQVRIVNRRLAGGGIRLQVDEQAKSYLASEGFDVLQGARPLRRLIQQKVLEPLAVSVLQGELREGDTVVIGMGKGREGDLQLTRLPAGNGSGTARQGVLDQPGSARLQERTEGAG